MPCIRQLEKQPNRSHFKVQRTLGVGTDPEGPDPQTRSSCIQC